MRSTAPEKEAHPYVVTEQNFTIRMLQPQAANPMRSFSPMPVRPLLISTNATPKIRASAIP